MKPGHADPRLVLKVTPPRVPKAAVVRQRLSSDQPPLADKPVIFVDAPSGFGKTTLLAQWRREALQRGAVVAWLTADAEDEPARLAEGLGLAMKTASGRAVFSKIVFVSPGEDDAGLEGLTEWLSEVAVMATETVLIIDDVQELPEASRRGSLAYLLHNAPANLKVILAARGGLDLSVADWVGHGHFVELGPEDLRLRLPETIALLTRQFGNRIDSDACARLHELTEGWPLGLQLVVATIEKQGSLREGIGAISARSGDIRRYFVECLIDRLPANLVEFLVRIAISADVHPGLCLAITGSGESVAILARLTDETPIFARGVDGDWLRLHSLARDFLLERYALLPLEERNQLHLRAARWLAENGMFEAAARQCLEGGATAMAYDLVEQGLFGVVVSGRVARATEWMERLPEEEVLRRPRLRLTAAWLMALSESHEQVFTLLGPMLNDESVAIDDRCESAAICGAAAFFADDLVGMERIIVPWTGALDARPALLRASIGNQIAALMLYGGGPDRVRRHYQNEMPEEAGQGAYIRGWAAWQIGFSYLWEGQAANAEESLRASLERIEAATGRRSPIAVMLASALAAALWERDLLGEAGTVLANRLDILEKRAAPDAIIMGVTVAARVAAASGLERRAHDLLDSLFSLGESRRLPRFGVHSLAEQLRMHALRGRSEVCATLLARLEALPLEAVRPRWGGIEPLVDIQLGIARAYAALSRRDWSRVIELLAVPGQLADERRRGRDALQIRLLRALAMRRCGDDGDGLLAESLSLASALGLERIVVDTHPDLVDWARRIRSAAEPAERPSLPQVDVLAQATLRPREKAARAKVAPSALLTPKERDILKLMADNLSNKQIGLVIGVSYETVKWHLKNLFAKLNASTRQHAVDRARMFGLLD